MKGAEIQLRSERMGYFYCWIASSSMLIYGYSLTMLSASRLDDIQSYYHIALSKDLILSTVNGFFAVGGLLGSLLTPYFIRITSKRYASSQSARATSSSQLPPSLPAGWCWCRCCSLSTSAASCWESPAPSPSEWPACTSGRLFQSDCEGRSAAFTRCRR
jgi:hypothetical protein